MLFKIKETGEFKVLCYYERNSNIEITQEILGQNDALETEEYDHYSLSENDFDEWDEIFQKFTEVDEKVTELLEKGHDSEAIFATQAEFDELDLTDRPEAILEALAKFELDDEKINQIIAAIFEVSNGDELGKVKVPIDKLNDTEVYCLDNYKGNEYKIEFYKTDIGNFYIIHNWIHRIQENLKKLKVTDEIINDIICSFEDYNFDGETEVIVTKDETNDNISYQAYINATDSAIFNIRIENNKIVDVWVA